ncbi:MAG: DUF1643 domain-containing protein [Anaerolineales bacterium]|nr:DUF1643 domain-containing protein [Anaerolineales bacterium]
MTDRTVLCLPPRPRRYRYWLELRLAGRGPRLAVILKNPSTATAEKSDPTVGKVSMWARRSGFGSLLIVNLFALRATHPAALNAVSPACCVGPKNDEYLCAAARWADRLVAAWGNPNGIALERYTHRLRQVSALLQGRALWRVGPLTALGQPRHGLWWTESMALAPFDFSG